MNSSAVLITSVQIVEICDLMDSTYIACCFPRGTVLPTVYEHSQVNSAEQRHLPLARGVQDDGAEFTRGTLACRNGSTICKFAVVGASLSRLPACRGQ